MKTTYDFIDSNTRKTILLIALFPLSLAVITYVSMLLFSYFYMAEQKYELVSVKSVFNYADAYFFYVFGIVLIFSALWTLISYYSGHKFILSSLNSRQADPDKDKEIIRIVENIAITAGIPAPKTYIIEDSALNAFATGRNPQNSYIALTSGLIGKLDKTELEGVIAHETAHIENSDTKLMLIIILVIGFFTLVGNLLMRMPSRGKGRNKGAVIIFIIGLILYLYGTVIAPLIRLAISRRREYQADATAALLTRNPQGLISALKKITQNPRVEAFQGKESMSHMCIENPLRENINLFDSLAGIFSTHPPVADRIKALEEMDGIYSAK